MSDPTQPIGNIGPAMGTSYATHGSPDYASRTAAGCEAAGEPVFLLRAQDAHASAAVRAWAAEVEVQGTDRALEMAAEARKIAWDMDCWPDQKEPD